MSRQFIKAFLVAMWFSILHWKNPIGRARGLFTLMFSKRAPADLEQSRNLECFRCTIFYHPLGTCGSPLDKDNPDLGCWCHCRTKNRLAGATCWLHDHTKGQWGWPERLYEKRKDGT